MRGSKAAGTLDSGVSIGGVGCIQFVRIANPFEAIDIVDMVQEGQVEVTWNTEDVVDADLTIYELVLDNDHNKRFVMWILTEFSPKGICPMGPLDQCRSQRRR